MPLFCFSEKKTNMFFYQHTLLLQKTWIALYIDVSPNIQEILWKTYNTIEILWKYYRNIMLG